MLTQESVRLPGVKGCPRKSERWCLNALVLQMMFLFQGLIRSCFLQQCYYSSEQDTVDGLR